MNIAVKAIHQNVIGVRGFSWAIVTNTTYQWILQISLLLVLVSALATVIATSKTRHDYRQLQSYQQHRTDAELQHGRLLLEQGALLAEARVAQVAGTQSGMSMPAQKMLVVV